MLLQISIKKALLPRYLLNIFGSKAVFFLLPCMLKDPLLCVPWSLRVCLYRYIFKGFGYPCSISNVNLSTKLSWTSFFVSLVLILVIYSLKTRLREIRQGHTFSLRQLAPYFYGFWNPILPFGSTWYSKMEYHVIKLLPYQHQRFFVST